ncbi:unnamed protein product, partial [Ectocarpus fasciculatus]
TDSVSYAVVYRSARVVHVISSATPIPPPTVVSARFSSTGMFLDLSFSAPTDQAGLFKSFACSALLDFNSITSALCQWVEASVIRITLSSKATLAPADSITVKSGLLRAQCPAASSVQFCSTWAAASTVAVEIVAPAVTTPPVLSLSAPTIIGLCDNMIVDFSGSSGSGGRQWKSATVTVESTSTNISKINSYVSAVDMRASGRVVVPNRLLEVGYSYRWTLRLCNFLGSCSEASTRVAMSNSAVPLNTILGNPLRSVQRNAELQLSSLANIRLCDGSVSSKNLHYAWTVYDASGAKLQGISSTSRDQKTLRLPAYTLPSAATYRVVSLVTNTESALSASASAYVYVSQGPVVAKIAGATVQSFRADGTLELDGSSSYDADNKAGTLSYQWTCVRQKPSYASSCGVNFVVSLDKAKLLVNASTTDYITESLFTLAVFGSGGRVASASVTVVVVEPSSPLVVVTSASLKVNPGARLQLSGYFMSSQRGIAKWSVDDGSLDLSAIALTPSSVSFGERPDATQQMTVNLVLPSGSLAARSTFLFSLQYTTNLAVVSTSSVLITTNGAPLNGVLVVDPENGTMLSTLFSMYSSQWQDEDLPMSHEFSYLTNPAGDYSV